MTLKLERQAYVNIDFDNVLLNPKANNVIESVAGYDELFKFLNLLGTVFGWVASDVEAKLAIIRGHRSGEQADKYESVQSMLAHEIETNMIKPKAKDSTTGTRNLLRLHRALEYIISFLEGVPALENQEKCCGMSQEAYKKTLMKFHPWVVQKAAMMAMHMLPTKEGLIQKICDAPDEDKIKEVTKTLEEAIQAMQKVYEITQELYKEKDLLSLPWLELSHDHDEQCFDNCTPKKSLLTNEFF